VDFSLGGPVCYYFTILVRFANSYLIKYCGYI